MNKERAEKNEEDFSAVFASILARVNENRPEARRVTLLDREVGKAIRDYVKDHPNDFVVFGDD